MHGEYRCYECRGIERTFHDPESRDRHVELRHGVEGKYGEIEGPPRKPEVSGGDFEKVHASLLWESDLLDDKIVEMRCRKDMIDDLLLSIQELGDLDQDGRAKKAVKPPAKPQAKKSPGKPVKKSAPAKAKVVETSKVGLPPSKGGTAPPGKPHWDKRSGRWTATTPKEDRVAASEAKEKPVKQKAEKAAKKSKHREPGADVGMGLDNVDDFESAGGEEAQEPTNANVDQATAAGGDIDSAEMHVETPLGWVMHNAKSNADMRWRKSRIDGETDEGLAQRINYELGDKGQMKGPDWFAAWKKDKSVMTLTISMLGCEPVAFVGDALVDKVREVLGVDQPTELSKKAG